jgi:regulator of extracellular matrix RemA (YlzA/DUF370 family)
LSILRINPPKFRGGLKFEPNAGIGQKKAFFKGLRIGVTDMDQNLLSIGFGNTVAAERVIAIVSPNSAPMKRLKDEAKDEKRLIDATHGRRTRSIIVMDSNHIVLSAIQAETISQRYTTLKEST